MAIKDIVIKLFGSFVATKADNVNAFLGSSLTMIASCTTPYIQYEDTVMVIVASQFDLWRLVFLLLFLKSASVPHQVSHTRKKDPKDPFPVS